MGAFDRTRLLLGSVAMEKLKSARVAIFGLGGVGGYVAEALARCGIGSLELVDHDTISETNINRQILALHSTVGLPKAEAARQRVLDINPEAEVTARQEFYGPDTAHLFDFSKYDYVVDAIDTVTGKLALIAASKAAGVPILCCMGTGNKLNPAMLTVTDISKTQMDPLAKVMRRELKKRGVYNLKVVYSEEKPIKPMEFEAEQQPSSRRSTPGSVSFVPSVAGLIIASEVIKDLI